MSQTSLILFKDGTASSAIEYRNAWGGCARIWHSLWQKYLSGTCDKMYGCWLNDQDRLWALQSDSRLTPEEQAVLHFTFDHFYVKRENFKRFSGALSEFIRMHQSESGYMDHIPAWAKVFGEADVEAIGLWGTSVCENPWAHYDGDKDRMVTKPLSEGYEVFEELELDEVKS